MMLKVVQIINQWLTSLYLWIFRVASCPEEYWILRMLEQYPGAAWVFLCGSLRLRLERSENLRMRLEYLGYMVVDSTGACYITTQGRYALCVYAQAYGFEDSGHD